MNRTRFFSAAVLGLGVGLVLAAGGAAQERVGDVEFSVYPMPGPDLQSGGGVRHGYVELRVRLKNTGKADRTVHLAYPRTRGRQIDYGVVVQRTVRIAAGQDAVVSLYQPPWEVADERLEVRVEGVAQGKEIRVASLLGYDHYSYDALQCAVLLSRSVPRDFPRDDLPDEDFLDAPAALTDLESNPEWDMMGGMGTGGMRELASRPEDRLTLLRSELPVGQWSPNWLGYSCYDAIVCSEKEAEEMPPQVRLAVRRYVECGGMLFLHGRKVPDAFSEDGVADGQGGYYVGMGKVIATLDNDLDDWDTTYRKLVDTRIHVHRPDELPGNLFNLLVAEATIPVRGLFLLVLLFGVGIGPANLWLLSRFRRRIWLWWNVPALSLLTCLLVFGYSMASEGWTGRGKTASLTLLDERCRRATTLGYLSYYCPLAPGGLRFDSDTDLALLATTSAQYRRHYRSHRDPSAGLRFVDWTRDQHLASGWMRARVPAYFQVRKNEDRRERLTLDEQPDGSVTAVNALGADIRRLVLVDRAGRVWQGSDIPAGAERTLSVGAGAVPDEGDPARMRALFTSSHWLGRFHDIDQARDPATLLAPGSYLAYLDRSPFIESPLRGVEPEHTVAIVYGILRGQEDGR